tara:strand:+ start:892 stop:2115 length:1224 start_codon:yes stop_codon:yes gene_type:complete
VWLSWLMVALWTLLIYVTIPLANALQNTWVRFWGRQSLLLVVVAVLSLATVITFLAMRRSDRKVRWHQYLWILLVFAAYIYFTYSLRSLPAEALHFIEYGVLGALAFLAFRHRVENSSIYFISAVFCLLVGTVDEIIQWIVPQRFWDYRDVWLNGVGGGLIQLGIWKGLSPSSVQKRWNPFSVRLLVRLTAASVILLSLCASNTPARFQWYTNRIGLLRPLAGNPQMMNEFGYRHADPDFGEFYSRLSLSELRENDERSAREAAKVLDDYSGDDRYQDFLHQYPSHKDPLIHEMRVHLFRRDRYMNRAREAEDEESQREYLTVARAENLIVSKYFTQTLSSSSYRLGPAARDLLERFEPQTADYSSAVDRHLVTTISERALWLMALIILFLLAGLHQYSYRMEERSK